MSENRRQYVSIVSGHFVIDMFTGVCGVLLAVLSGPLGLSNTQIGTAITLYMLTGSVSQPVFGWLSDRTSLNMMLLVSLSIAWMAGCFALVSLAPVWWLVVALIMLAALGSGLFHPIGTAQAKSLAASGAANTSTAFFFLCGQMGLALGPFIGGVLFDALGTPGILPVAALALVPAALAWSTAMRMRAAGPAPVPASTGDAQHWTQIARRLLSVVVLAFVLLVAVRSSIQATYQFLLPKLLEDRGWEASVYGALAGVFMGTAAVGNVIVGKLADRFGMRVVTTAALLLSVPTGLLLLTTPSTLLAFVACGLTGFLTGGLHSVLVVHAQQLLPVRQGFAAGLILGFTFASGAIGTWVCGFVGDIVGLQPAMQGLALMGVPAALLALALPKHLPGEGGEDAEDVEDVLVGGGPQPAAR